MFIDVLRVQTVKKKSRCDEEDAVGLRSEDIAARQSRNQRGLRMENRGWEEFHANSVLRAHKKAGFLGFIALRGFPELRFSLGKKFISHRFSFLSSSRKTSGPGIPGVRPASYLLILSQIRTPFTCRARRGECLGQRTLC